MHSRRLLLVLGLVGGCTGGMAGAPDAPVQSPDAGGCDPVSALPAGWQPIAQVSPGAVSDTVGASSTTTDIDATAGGISAFGSNPFVYVTLDPTTGASAKVSITDGDSFAQTGWDLGLK